MDRYDELVKILNRHSDLYYNKNTSEISDYEYDMLVSELRESKQSTRK